MNLTPLILMTVILLVITVVLAIARRFLADYGESKVSVNKEKELTVQGGGSLLELFANNDIFIPSACGGKATCGHCKVKILSGGGQILPTEEIYINNREKESGIRLACQVKVRGELDVYIPEHLLEAGRYRTVVQNITELTHDIKQIDFEILEPNEMNFKPGQYIQIKVPGTDEYRAYSIASPPSRKNGFQLNIRLVPGGLCSTYIHHVLEVGTEMDITGPFGDFYLNEKSEKGIICIAGGCGMAPVRSIIYHLAERGMPRKLIYFFGARSKRDIFYTEEFRILQEKFPNFTYVPALSEPQAVDKWEGEVGLITHVLEKYIDNADEYEVYIAGRHEDISILEAYLCGPPPMIDAAIHVLTRKGMKDDEIYYDKF